MSARQLEALRALCGGAMTDVALAQRLDTTMAGVYRILDALLRRGLVCVTPAGRYAATERGRRKAAV